MNSKAFFLFVLMVIGLFVVVISVGQTAVTIWGQQAMQPETVADVVMRSRQTAPVSPTRTTTGWWGAGLLAIVLLIMAAILFLMRGGTDFLRQWRLARKADKRPQKIVHAPTATYVSDMHQVPTVPSARRLVRSEHETVHDDSNYS